MVLASYISFLMRSVRSASILIFVSLFLIVSLHGSTVYASGFSFKFNGKEVDLGEFFGVKKNDKDKKEKKHNPKKSAKRKPKKKVASPKHRPKPATPDEIDDTFLFGDKKKGAVDPGKVVAGKNKPVDTSGKVAENGASIGLSIRGVRIGMTPDDVQKAIKDMGVRSRVYHRRLHGGHDYNFSLEAESLDHMTGIINKSNYYHRSLNAVFTPAFPGEEVVMDVSWLVKNPQGKRPSVATFEKAIKRKYGEPTYSKSGNRRRYWWIYDIDGKLMSNMKVAISTLGLCSNNMHNSALQESPASSMAQTILTLRSQCGSYTLYMEANTQSALVKNYYTVLHGNEEYIYSAVQTKAKIKSTIERRLHGTANEDEKIKPEL